MSHDQYCSVLLVLNQLVLNIDIAVAANTGPLYLELNLSMTLQFIHIAWLEVRLPTLKHGFCKTGYG